MEQYLPPEFVVGSLLFLFVFGLITIYLVFRTIGWAKIGKKCGYSPGWIGFWMGLGIFLPFISDVFFFTIAFKKTPWSIFALKNKEKEMIDRIANLEDQLAEKATPDKTGPECECPPSKCECSPDQCTCGQE